MMRPDYAATVKHQELLRWVKETADFCEPDQIYWCDGSDTEYDYLCQMLVDKGTFIRLDPEKRPNSYACFKSTYLDWFNWFNGILRLCKSHLCKRQWF